MNVGMMDVLQDRLQKSPLSPVLIRQLLGMLQVANSSSAFIYELIPTLECIIHKMWIDSVGCPFKAKTASYKGFMVARFFAVKQVVCSKLWRILGWYYLHRIL